MVKKTEKSLVVGLDIGTSKIVAIVGEMQSDGSVEVIGLGSHASRGLKRGVVVDMASTEQAIQRAVEEAELMAGCEIHSVFCGISGNHIRSQNSDGTVAIKDKEVTEARPCLAPVYWSVTSEMIWLIASPRVCLSW